MWSAISIALALILCMFTFDAPLHRWLETLDHDLRHRLGGLSILGDSKYSLIPAGIGFLLSLAALRLSSRSRLRDRQLIRWLRAVLAFAFCAVALAGLLVNLFKLIIGRGRPKLFDELGAYAFHPFAFDSTFASLPSGHANTVFALALVLCLLQPAWRVAWLAVAAWLAFSRVLIEAHYLTDVLAGAALAVPVVGFCQAWCAQRRILFMRADTGFRLRGRGLLRDWMRRTELRARMGVLVSALATDLEAWRRRHLVRRTRNPGYRPKNPG